jgi:hypothetical protein
MGGLLGLITGPVLDIVNKLIPDPAAKAQAQLELLQLQQNAQFKEIDAQLQAAQQQTDIDKTEASSNNAFEADWRAFIGWICGVGLGLNYLVIPMLNTGGLMFGHKFDIPLVDTTTLMPLLLGMLGLGGMKTYENVTGGNSGS